MSPVRSALLLAALVASAAPLRAAGQAGGPPSGLTATFSLAGGGELGLDEGEEAAFGEVEVTLGYDLAGTSFRPELGLAAGFAPEGHVAVRAGGRLQLPELPIAVRAAVDASNARGDGLRWRWILVGLAAEVRFTGVLGLYAEVDSGIPLSGDAGVPLLARAGASFRF